MTIAYFDCFAGAGGDMIVGALIDAGADIQAIRSSLARLDLASCRLNAVKVSRSSLCGTKFQVEVESPEQTHRHLSDILAIIDAAGLAERPAERARRIFRRLGQAEAKVHGIAPEEVHFHEVGAIDSIMDIVGACVAMELLGIDRVYCSAIPVGSGTVECDHGTFCVPAPATAELLAGAKIAPGELAGEITTPTAAAVLTTLAESYGPIPAMEISAVGYGAGARDSDATPNLLRVMIGQPAETGTADTVMELAVNLDDCTGEILGVTIEKLLEAGCLDAWATAAVTKKSRPGWVLSALCAVQDVDKAERIIFSETTALGIRRRPAARSKLGRSFETIETPYGPVRMKVAALHGQTVTAACEFDDARRAAEAHHVPVKQVIAAAETIYRQGKKP